MQITPSSPSENSQNSPAGGDVEVNSHLSRSGQVAHQETNITLWTPMECGGEGRKVSTSGLISLYWSLG